MIEANFARLEVRPNDGACGVNPVRERRALVQDSHRWLPESMRNRKQKCLRRHAVPTKCARIWNWVLRAQLHRNENVKSDRLCQRRIRSNPVGSKNSNEHFDGQIAIVYWQRRPDFGSRSSRVHSQALKKRDKTAAPRSRYHTDCLETGVVKRVKAGRAKQRVDTIEASRRGAQSFRSRHRCQADDSSARSVRC